LDAELQAKSSRPPRALVAAVACVAAAMLLFEVVVTRLFSVLFYYHFSFFAISLVMSGLVVGGRVFDDGKIRYLVIDRSAATFMRHIPPPIQPDPSWAGGAQYVVYRTGRPLRSVAIIGVGGGGDLLPPIFYGATQVEGYEINQTMIDFLERDFRDYNGIAARPEVRLIHDEARVGIAHSGRLYDVIQASLIDTRAATASGGFVLSENALHTLPSFALLNLCVDDGWVLHGISLPCFSVVSQIGIPEAVADFEIFVMGRYQRPTSRAKETDDRAAPATKL
jgi:hypothetical protein